MANKTLTMLQVRRILQLLQEGDNQIYSMPMINGEIKQGIAMISGLNNESIAKNISESLNLSIPK
jgi:hypothetical protein